MAIASNTFLKPNKIQPSYSVVNNAVCRQTVKHASCFFSHSNHLRSTTTPHLHNIAVQNVIIIVVDLERQSLRYSRSQSKRHLNRGTQQNYVFIYLLHSLEVQLPNNFSTQVNMCNMPSVAMIPKLVITPHGVRNV